ncbi:MAG: cell division protein ZipA C-terminal FtsZ-binding domain-containing protein [Granulosicoccus sp.]
MENLRWILILAGVAILVLLYLSGRKRSKPGSLERRGPQDDNDFDPLLGDDTLGDQIASFDDVDPDEFLRSGHGLSYGPGNHAGKGAGSGLSPVNLAPSDYELEDDLGRTRDSSPGFTSFAQKIESISERLSPKRRQRIAESEPEDIQDGSPSDPEFANKIVTLHVVAPQNSLIDGAQLLDVFDRRGYHFGELNIFHSMHKGVTVFSIAKMVEPGFFDIDDIDSFVTPGITLILQLPGPVPADVSFEVLISEAFEMASELNAAVLDGDRNTLSKQTLQHMREGIYEYMHRQKYFGSVPS